MSDLECDLHIELSKVSPSSRRRNPRIPDPTSPNILEDVEEGFCSTKFYCRVLILSLVLLFYAAIFYLGVMGQLNFGNLLPLSRIAQTRSAAYRRVMQEEWAEAFEKRHGPGGGGKITEGHHGLISMIRTLYLYPPLTPPPRPPSIHNSTNPFSRFIRHVFRNKTNGFFLEYRAFKGESDSGNFDLENSLRWNGLLIEPDPALALQVLRLYRSVWVSDACLSTLPTLHKMSFLQRWIPAGHNGSDGDDRMSRSAEVTVQCVPLYSLLLAVNISVSVDYFYLDSGGTEYKILKEIPYDRVRIGVIVIRNCQSAVEGQMIRFLETKGYVRAVIPGSVQSLTFVQESLQDSLPGS